MNGLKSLFVTSYMMSVVIVTLFAFWSLMVSDNLLSWAGVLLVTLPFMITLVRMMITTGIARTSERLPVINALGFVGLVLTMVAYIRGGSGLAPILALFAWVGFLLYAYWYSSFSRKASPLLTPGKKLPEFIVRNIQGEAISSTLLFDKPAIWLFYRGNWCPLCMAQIKELAQQYQELEALGVRVALIAPQPHENTVDLAKKFGVNFDFLTDEGSEAARLLGIGHAQGLPRGMELLGYDQDTVLPTVIITAVGGKILWVDETDNYRVRPEPEVFLSVLRGNKAVPGVA